MTDTKTKTTERMMNDVTTDNMGGLISAAVAARLTPEYVEKHIDSKINKLMEEAINDALRSYSKTGQLIREKIEESLRVTKLDLPTYGDTVAGMLKTQIETHVSELVAGKLKEDMKELLSLAPKNVKLSDITAEMLTDHEHGGECGDVITCIIERNEYGGTWLYLDERNPYTDSEKYRADIRVLISKDGTISYATINGKDTKDARYIGKSYGLEQKIRAYAACSTVIEIDEDCVYTSVGDL